MREDGSCNRDAIGPELLKTNLLYGGLPMNFSIPEAQVEAWAPVVVVADDARAGTSLEDFRQSAPEAFSSPEITFRNVGDSYVLGWCAAIRSGPCGDIEDTLHGVTPPRFDDLVPEGFKVQRLDGIAPLVIGNGWHKNYYHWTLQALSTLLLFRKHCGDLDVTIATPSLNGWRRQTLALIDFEGRVIEMDYKDVLDVGDCITSNLTGGTFAHTPHPAVLAEFEAIAAGMDDGQGRGRKIYVSRLDAGDVRRVVNEKAVCDFLANRGFEIVTPAELSVEDQATAFRDAEVIVAPHGAGLANLVYCPSGRGTRMIELFQASCLNACYAKICQTKGMDYTAIVNPDCVGLQPDGTPKDVRTKNDMWQIVDLDLLEKVLCA